MPLKCLVLIQLGLILLVWGQTDVRSRCKTMPSDSTWPTISVWNVFNASIDGRLIRTVPIAAPCHRAQYNAASCESIRSQWHQPLLHEEYASSIMSPVFLNKTCDPFTDIDGQCEIGSYVQYSVNVGTQDHIKKTLAFAKKHNIRFVVKNTGHDYMGKSTGAGGLAIWTHNLTGREWLPQYESKGYTGPAIKIQAGVIGDMLGIEGEQRGQVVVAGQCPTVGFAGGYVQGGGHSVLSSLYGMAADQVLEFEVITTNGRVVRASATENSDLFWALRGGGGGTYGIVWTVTVKVYPDMKVTTVRVLYTPESSGKAALDTHWKGINSYLTASPKYIAAGAYHITYFDNTMFHVVLLFPKKTPEEVNKLIKPWLDNLHDLKITPQISETKLHPTLRSASLLVYEVFGGEILIGTDLYGARILPKRLWNSKETRETLYKTLRGIVDDGGHILDIAVDPSRKVSGNPDNAILPAFRSMHSMCVVVVNWNDTGTWESEFAKTSTVTAFTKRLIKIAPETGAYLNEADAFDPNWQKNFYGENYERLLSIKNKWDPEGVLYGTTAVGGDKWITVDGGRLCRKGA